MKAASFAARKHRKQLRADGATPYFSHVVRVTLIARHLFGITDNEVLAATLLHDVIEDTDTDIDDVADAFGECVAQYVVLLTKNKMLPRKDRDRDYEQRLSAAPEQVQIAKLADVFDNLSDRIGSPKFEKTLATAKKWLSVFDGTLTTSAGRRARQIVAQLVAQIESARAT